MGLKVMTQPMMSRPPKLRVLRVAPHFIKMKKKKIEKSLTTFETKFFISLIEKNIQFTVEHDKKLLCFVS